MKFSLPINLNIAGTLRAWRSEFVGGRIVSLDDIKFKDFEPATTFGAMAATDYIVNQSRYCIVSSLLFFTFDIQATLAATFGPEIVVRLPATAAGATGKYQAMGGAGQNGGAGEAVFCQVQGGSTSLGIYRPALANYSAGSWRAFVNGFIEID